MFTRFLVLEWKSFVRSASFGKNLAVKLLLGFLVLYLIATALLIGFSLYPILEKTFPNQAPIYSANQLVVIWFLTEIFIRFMFQSLPVSQSKQLITNNIKKNTIIHFLLAKSFFSVYNLFTPLIVIPFSGWNLYKNDVTVAGVLGWTFMMLTFSGCCNFIVFLLKKKFSQNLKALLPYFGILLIFIALEKFNIFKTSEFVGNALNWVIKLPFLAILPFLGILLLYKLNFNYLKNHFYLDETFDNTSKKGNLLNFSWAKYFGQVAPFLQLDLKLLWRNKRTKSILWFTLFCTLYGLGFYPNPSFKDSIYWLIFVGIFLSGIFMSNFGQFIPAWDSSYYPLLMSQNVLIKQYIQSKAVLLYFSIIITYLLTTPYLLFGKHIFLINIACAIYNAGINVPIILYVGAFNKKRIDLERSSMMNYQGTSATQFILMIPVLVIPMLIHLLISNLLSDSWTTLVFVLSGLGILGLLLKNTFIRLIVNKYKSRKYITINGFRET